MNVACPELSTLTASTLVARVVLAAADIHSAVPVKDSFTESVGSLWRNVECTYSIRNLRICGRRDGCVGIRILRRAAICGNNSIQWIKRSYRDIASGYVVLTAAL